MKTKYWILLFVLLAAGCLAAGLFLSIPDTPATTAQVRSGDTEITLNLLEDQEFTLSTPEGGYNTITVREGKIAVTEANCPDHYCVKQGFCNSGVEIVCLPHGLVISFLDDSGIDGAVG